MVYIIGGLPGAGKSTYAEKLAGKNNGIVFATDVWMSDLYWKDKSPGSDLQWALERTTRCESRMIKTCFQLSNISVSSVLDIGFVNKQFRLRTYEHLDSLNLNFEVHFLNVDEPTRWERVQRRNAEKSDTYSFEVTREMFDFMSDHFDELTGSETEKKIVFV